LKEISCNIRLEEKRARASELGRMGIPKQQGGTVTRQSTSAGSTKSVCRVGEKSSTDPIHSTLSVD
jgi:hypothetical protein